MAPPKEPPTFSIPGGDGADEDNNVAPSIHTKPGASTQPAKRDPHLRLPAFTSMTSLGTGKGTNGNEGDTEYNSGEDDDDPDAFYAADSTPQTPNISETAQQLRRSLSVHGLHQLSSMPPQEIRKSVSNKVWRPHDEEIKLPNDWERLSVHVFRGGLRAFNLAFGLRGTLMLVLALIKGLRKRKTNGKDLREAMFSKSNFRFGLLFGVWAGIYKTVHNSLRLSTPMPPSRSQRPHRSLSLPEGQEKSPVLPNGESNGTDVGSPDLRSGTQTPRSGYHQLAGKTAEEKSRVKSEQKRKAFMRDPRSKVWHAYVAGAVSSLAILVETKENRISLAQQLFVRGAEGTYNVAHAKGIVNIPHGAVIAFGLACGQIMYAWLNAPETLPRGYVSWITNASMVAPKALNVHRDIANKRPVDTDFVLKHWFPGGKAPPAIGKTSDGLLKYGNIPVTPANRRGITSKNASEIMAWIDRAKAGHPGAAIPCHLVHPWESSHWWGPLDRFVEVTRWIL